MKRLAAALFVVLLIAATIGSFAGGDALPFTFGVVVAVLLWIVALVISGVVLAGVAAVMRRRPPQRAVAIVFALMAILVLPIEKMM